jgi:hypothetical protein
MRGAYVRTIQNLLVDKPHQTLRGCIRQLPNSVFELYDAGPREVALPEIRYTLMMGKRLRTRMMMSGNTYLGRVFRLQIVSLCVMGYYSDETRKATDKLAIVLDLGEEGE